jgi:hypothetical protein
MISGAQRADRANFMRQHRQASLSQLPANTVKSQSLVQTDDITGIVPDAEVVTTMTANTVGDNF